ncbi:MAG: class I SAM-dependent methyltransferase [Terriglobia bacterium]
MSSKDQVKDLFTKTVDDWARFYNDPKPSTLGAQNLVSRMRFALEMLESKAPPGAKVLDVGCGAGQLVGELMRRGYEAWGVDVSEAMVGYAREHYQIDRFRAADIENLPFPDGTFDAVMCLGVMEYLNQDEAALREMRRVLKPGGRAVITTPSVTCPFYYMDMAYQQVRPVARPLVRWVRHGLLGRQVPPASVLPNVVHRRYYRRRWVRLMRSLGLELEDWVCHAWGWYSLEWLFNQGAFCRASDRFARMRWVSGLASDQLACVRAVK